MTPVDALVVVVALTMLWVIRRAAGAVTRRRPMAVALLACTVAGLRLMQFNLPGGIELELLGAALTMLMLGSAAGSRTLCAGLALAAAARGVWPVAPGIDLLTTVLLPGLIIPGLLL